MITLPLDVPEGLLAALRRSPEDFTRELRFAGAAAWYEQGALSQEMAAQLAGMDRTDFLLALARSGRDSFRVDFADLDRELSRE